MSGLLCGLSIAILEMQTAKGIMNTWEGNHEAQFRYRKTHVLHGIIDEEDDVSVCVIAECEEESKQM